MSRSYLVGVDLGSGACKLTILSSDGNVVATASKEYPTYYPYPSYAEQEPDDWYLAVRDTFAEAMTLSGVKAENIAAICVDSATHTAVLTDESVSLCVEQFCGQTRGRGERAKNCDPYTRT